jgi:hypothetical protein
MIQFTVRPYRHSDYSEILSWWDEASVPGPMPGEMVEDGTFVLEIGGVPSMSLTVFLTQSKSVAYLEGYIAKPGVPDEDRDLGACALWRHCFQFVKDRGYSNVFIYAGHPKLVKRYEDLGMTRSLSGLTVLHRKVA